VPGGDRNRVDHDLARYLNRFGVAKQRQHAGDQRRLLSGLGGKTSNVREALTVALLSFDIVGEADEQ
jgi:hypothetical protein